MEALQLCRKKKELRFQGAAALSSQTIQGSAD